MKDKGEVIWEDLNQKPEIFEHSILFVISSIFVILFIVSLIIGLGNSASFAFLVLLMISLLHFILGIRLRYLIIEKKGVWTGNNTSGQMIGKLFRLKQKNIFLRWGEISEIDIAERIYAVSYAGGKKLFVVIKPKDKKECECLIADISGFLQTLKKLNKDYLLKDKKRMYEKYGIE